MLHAREIWDAYNILVGKLKGKYHSGDLGIGGRIILKWVLKKWSRKVRTRFVWLRVRTDGGLLWTREWTLRVKWKAYNFLTRRATISLSRRTLFESFSADKVAERNLSSHLMMLRVSVTSSPCPFYISVTWCLGTGVESPRPSRLTADAHQGTRCVTVANLHSLWPWDINAFWTCHCLKAVTW
jgi:hypothetical protein